MVIVLVYLYLYCEYFLLKQLIYFQPRTSSFPRHLRDMHNWTEEQSRNWRVDHPDWANVKRKSEKSMVCYSNIYIYNHLTTYLK